MEALRPRPVAVTGLGFVGATGLGVPSLSRALAERRDDSLGPLTLFPSVFAGEIPLGQYRGDLTADAANLLGRSLLPGEQRRLSRSDLLALVAAAEALAQSGLAPPQRLAARTGLYLGHSVCGTLASEAYYIARKTGAEARDPASLVAHEAANTVDRLAPLFGLPGPCASFMTACSSGANAIGLAVRAIRQGRAEAMLAGGSDSLSRIALNGFHSLQVVSREGPRPFDRDRPGMTLGEGAGVLVLESLEHAKRRGAKALALLSGYGHSCDAWHLTAPHPEGLGAIAAMRAALRDAGLAPSEIGYVNAHGTGTKDNDGVEALALQAIFGPEGVPVSSTKRFLGHTLAAAGAMEAVICALALRGQTLPANLGLREPLDEAPLDLVREPRAVSGLRHVLSNSFGFGGNNAALVLSAPEEASRWAL